MNKDLLPREECNLTSGQAEDWATRHDLACTFLVLSGQFSAIVFILLSWIGPDLSYSSGWAHPIAYYFAIVLILIAVFGIAGIQLRRGMYQAD